MGLDQYRPEERAEGASQLMSDEEAEEDDQDDEREAEVQEVEQLAQEATIWLVRSGKKGAQQCHHAREEQSIPETSKVVPLVDRGRLGPHVIHGADARYALFPRRKITVQSLG